MESYKCEFCNTIVKSLNILKCHQKRAKYCIKIQKSNNIITQNDIQECIYCKKQCASNLMNRHLKSCKGKKEEEIIKYKNKIIELENILKEKEYDYQILKEKMTNILFQKDLDIRDLRCKIEIYEDDHKTVKEIAKQPFLQNINYNLFEIKIDDIYKNYNEENFSVEKEFINETYQLTPLEIENGFIIEYRDEDGYINITNLCKAGGKHFKNWIENDKSKSFLEVLSYTIGIHKDELIKYESEEDGYIKIWAHPQVTINISQWISSQFNVKVSSWIYEIITTGKGDIQNIKTYNELVKENKSKDLRIKFLTDKYVKKQRRTQYIDGYLIYILTTKNLKKEGIYVFGKTDNLTKRLSTYNKSEEHEVIYYQDCKEKDIMDYSENLIYKKLKKYRQQANRDRFILPTDKEINYFTNTVKNCIEFLSL